MFVVLPAVACRNKSCNADGHSRSSIHQETRYFAPQTMNFLEPLIVVVSAAPTAEIATLLEYVQVEFLQPLLEVSGQLAVVMIVRGWLFSKTIFPAGARRTQRSRKG